MRYSRQEVLKHIGKEGQKKLANSSAAIIGLGSTGTVTAELLARAGVGKLILIDHDVVEESNLNRQLLYSEDDVEAPKAEAAAHRLAQINSDIEIIPMHLHLAYENIQDAKADIILDCTDNMRTRLLLNDYALREGVPWIYCAAVEDRGMVYVTNGEGACFDCIFKDAQSFEDCETAGILNSASTMAASIQATEALKILLGEEPSRDLISINAWKNEYNKFKAKKNPDCDACNGKYNYLQPADEDYKVEYCKSKAAMSAKPLKDMNLDMDKLKKEFEVKADAGIVTVIDVEGEEVVVHDYGELLFKNEKNEDRLKELAEKIYEAAR